MAQPKDDTLDKDGFVDELKPGTKLMHGQYTIDSFLNAGGFGITYLARDSLDRKVVIKECFPGAFCRRSRFIVQARSRAHQNELKSIVRLFVQEARSLSKLDHPNIVGVHQVFEDNDTAYMALDFVEGRDLLDTIEDPNHGLVPAQIKSILKEVLGAVGFIHDQGMLHRDISPDNILINQDFHPILIDFGAAREEATKQSRVLSALRVVKDGYSPQEFYIAGSDQNPSSDLYALAASFHHLITGDVPPNSQARLAAIASGDPDPYTAIAGRFPDYDNNFLAAMDKALAVLPKDRVQSAKEWVQIIEGVEGNVTPLNVTSNSPAAAASAGSESAAKSKMPILLGSAAAVALLVGVGVMTMSGGEDAPVAQAPAAAETPVAQAPAVKEPVVQETVAQALAVEEPVVQETVAQAPAVEEPVVQETVAQALAVEEPVAQEPAVEEPVAQEPVTETPVAQAPAAETPVAKPPVVDTPVVTAEPVQPVPAEETVAAAVPETIQAPVEAPAAIATPQAVEAPSVVAALEEAIAEPVAPIVNEATPSVSTEPAEPATSSNVTVTIPVTADTPTPTIRPEARPEAVVLAVPAPVPMPAPIVTPEMAADASLAGAVFPEQITSLPTIDSAKAQLGLPDTPVLISTVGNGPVVDILAVTPGNEIIVEEPTPADTGAGIVGSWTVRLPFTPMNPTSNVIAGVAAVSPEWVKPGLLVTGVNGTPINAINDIPNVLRAQTPEESLSPTIAVTFETRDPTSDEQVTQLWFLPVVQQVQLADGTTFETVFAGSGWQTSVIELADGQNGGLKVGDVITSYIPTSENVDARETLLNIFKRERENGAEQFMFAVQRDGSLWVASLAYPGAAN